MIRCPICLLTENQVLYQARVSKVLSLYIRWLCGKRQFIWLVKILFVIMSKMTYYYSVANSDNAQQGTTEEKSPDKKIRIVAGEIRTPPFSREARLEAGFLLRKLQQGELLSLPHSRPMPSIGNGVHELRIRDADANWRILYYLDTDTIVILEVFSKKTQQTPTDVIDNCKRRVATYIEAKSKETRASEKETK